MQAIGIIPARYTSTRFPGKPLVEINGKAMIQHVYEQAAKCTLLKDIYVATDDERIANCVKAFGGQYVMTSPDHQSGTDRCEEALSLVQNDNRIDVVVNIQGDEPYIHPESLTQLIETFTNAEVDIATLVKKIKSEDELFDHNVVKCVRSKDDKALYFSRQAIPFNRNAEKENWLKHQVYWKHIGLYAYRPDILHRITQLPPSSLEKTENLEQLRWIENNFCIFAKETEHESFSVDTPNDLKKLEQIV